MNHGSLSTCQSLDRQIFLSACFFLWVGGSTAIGAAFLTFVSRRASFGLCGCLTLDTAVSVHVYTNMTLQIFI